MSNIRDKNGKLKKGKFVTCNWCGKRFYKPDVSKKEFCSVMCAKRYASKKKREKSDNEQYKRFV